MVRATLMPGFHFDQCGKCVSIRQRWILSVLSGLICLVKTMSETSFGVTLVAMVNNTEQIPASVDDTCRPMDNQTEIIRTPVVGAPIYNWSRQMQGAILGAYRCGILILQFVGGNISQRYGGKWVIAIGTLAAAIFNTLKPLSAEKGPVLLLVITAMQGMVSGVIWPGVFAMYGRWIPPEETATLTSFSNIGATTGQFLGLLISGPICASQMLGGWPSVFYINGAIAIAISIIWCLLVSSSPENHPCISPHELQYIKESLNSRQIETNQTGIPWRSILLSRATISWIIASFGYGWIIAMPSTFLPQYLSDVLHLSIRNNSLLLSLTCLIKPAVLIPIARIMDSIINRQWLQKNTIRKIYAAVGVIGFSCAYTIIPFVSCDTWAVISLFIVSMGFFQFLSLTYVATPLDLTPEFSGTLFALGSSFYTIGSIMAPIAADIITVNKRKSEWDIVLYLTIAILASSNLIFLIFGTSERQYQWAEEEKQTQDLHKKSSSENLPLVKKGNE